MISYVKDEVIIRALVEFNPKLKGINNDSLFQLLQKVTYLESEFIDDTDTYCARIEGEVIPIEIIALLELSDLESQEVDSSITTEEPEDNLIPTENLVVHYSFDGTVRDESGNGNDGTAFGGIQFVDGKVGQAARFNGSNGYIRNSSPPVLQVLDSTFIVSFWMMPESSHVGGIINIGQERKEAWQISYIDKNVQFAQNWNRSQGFKKSGYIISTPPNIWSFVAFVYDKKHLSVYVNGKKTVEQQFEENPIIDGDEWLEIGVNAAGGDEYFKGRIDEVRIYNRALDHNEILALNGQNDETTGNVQAKDGAIDYGLAFDGINDYLDISLVRNYGSKIITYAAWVKPNSTRGPRAIITRGDPGGRRGVSFGIVDGKVWVGGRNNSDWNNSYLGTINANEWTHIAAIYNQEAKSIKVYVNGDSAGTASGRSFAIDGDNFNTIVGRNHVGDKQFFDGFVDDIWIWQRELTESEIKDIKNGRIIIQDDLVA